MIRISNKVASAEVAEGVRATIAEYSHALDAGRTNKLVSLFCADGVADLPHGISRGRDDLLATYTSLRPRTAQRHLVTNLVVYEVAPDQARALSDVALILPGASQSWRVEFMGTQDDLLSLEGERWRFRRRVLRPVGTPPETTEPND